MKKLMIAAAFAAGLAFATPAPAQESAYTPGGYWVVQGVTVASASTAEKSFSGATGTVDAAKKIGKLLGERAKDAGVESVVFDRGGNRYHGRVAGIADGAREAGLTL